MKKFASLAAAALAAASLNAQIVVLDETHPSIILENNLLKFVSPDTLSSANQYIIPGQLFVTSSATLTIEAGTILRGTPGAQSPFSAGSDYNGGSLIVCRDGQIDAGGSRANPIIFTTAALDDGSGDPDTSIDYRTVNWAAQSVGDFWDDQSDNGSAQPPLKVSGLGDFTGDISSVAATNTTSYQEMWGGVVILGNAPTSIGRISGSKIIAGYQNDRLPSIVNEPYEGQIEGLVTADIGELSVYGGRNPNDSSGTLRFVSIRHGGEQIGDGNEINGLTLGGVGAGSQIEFVEVYSNNDDGFEFFGGTVNTRYLAVTTVADDSFDIDEGFTGLGQFWFSFQPDDLYNGDQSGEHDGTADKHRSVDQDFAGFGSGDTGGGLTLAFPTIYNATYVGGGRFGNRNQDSSSQSNQLFTIRDSFGGAYFNSIFSDARDGAMAVSSDGEARFALGDVVFRSNIWYGNNVGFTTQEAFQATQGGRDGPNNKAFDVFNQVGPAFKNNVFNDDPWAAGNRVSGASTAAHNGQIKRRNYISGFASTHGGFDPAEVTTAVTGLTLEPYTSTFFINAGFAGAFNPQADTNGEQLWTEGWTAFDALFYEDR